jgi:hypothetical protein
MAEVPSVRLSPRSQVARLYRLSQKTQVLEHAPEHGVTAAALKFEVRRFSVYDGRRKLMKPAARGAIADERSCAVRHRGHVRWRDSGGVAQAPGLAASQIVNQLRRAGIKVACPRPACDGGGRLPPSEGSARAARPMLRSGAFQSSLALGLRAAPHEPVDTFTLILIDDGKSLLSLEDFFPPAYPSSMRRHRRLLSNALGRRWLQQGALYIQRHRHAPRSHPRSLRDLNRGTRRVRLGARKKRKLVEHDIIQAIRRPPAISEVLRNRDPLPIPAATQTPTRSARCADPGH